jgi:hypothetical protein
MEVAAVLAAPTEVIFFPSAEVILPTSYVPHFANVFLGV